MHRSTAPHPLPSSTPTAAAGWEIEWQSERAVQLGPQVLRLTAPNPGVMTGPGTNSYLVGDAAHGFVVIDPGPADAGHVQRLWDSAQGQIHTLLCTHSHPDHAPGARLLQALCAQTGRSVPILGLASGPHARADSAFVPDRAVAHEEWLPLQPLVSAPNTLRLQILHTPGHASNHLCVLFPAAHLLFSGDHILNGSTTVIAPPDGHMGDYIASLDLLHAHCSAQQVQYIAPAHGHVMHHALDVIAQLKQHRLRREAKIAAVRRAHPEGNAATWLPLAYDDVPPALWPVAQHSLRAHLERLDELAHTRPAPDAT